MKNKFASIFLLFTFATSVIGCNQPATFTVTLDANGGKLSETTYSVTSGSTLELPTPYKKGRQFLGWFTGWGNEDVEYTKDTKFTSNVNLIAKWDKYSCTFIDGNNYNFTTVEVNPGEKVVAPKLTPGKKATETTEYVFDSWSFDFDTIINSDYTINSTFTTNEITWKKVLLPGLYFDGPARFDYIIDEHMFESSATTFNRHIALYANGLVNCITDKTTATNYLTSEGCDDIYFSKDWGVSGSLFSFVFAHKKINDNDLIYVIGKGRYYSAYEWGLNFVVGEDGPHQGFYQPALLLESELAEYLKTYQETPYKMLLAGYSRAGGVIDLVAKDLIDNEVIEEENMFAYTYEAPTSIPERLLEREYNSIFNIYNSAELIPNVVPYQFDQFVHPGVMVDIYKSDVDNILLDYSPNLKLEKIKALSPFKDETALPKELLNRITSFESDEYPTMRNREEYVNNYQDLVVYCFNLFSGLSKSTINKIKNAFKDMDTMDLLIMLNTENGLFNKLNPHIKNDGVTYDEAEFKVMCNRVTVALMKGPLSGVVSLVPYMSRAITMHYPEVNFALLLYY